ncbi:hypothetical protein LPB67_11930 [Undibacterium sp. Jales W-56]|uniref:hypothetical protein n=1 Tax=Undibacterium sp. Jales W-56 TaxID=2897325 RepID=UPI0021D1657B|nr:hypothetical protein [Undibacterium sp. Jales W-56]MCU6434481.1 hypothetical protein [Undibacterium sp. Jales W-56]
MANRIPPSLKWLIVKRARLDSESKKTEAALKRSQRLLEELTDCPIKPALAANEPAFHRREPALSATDRRRTYHRTCAAFPWLASVYILPVRPAQRPARHNYLVDKEKIQYVC